MAPLTQLLKPGSYPVSSLSIILASNPLAAHWLSFQNTPPAHLSSLPSSPPSPSSHHRHPGLPAVSACSPLPRPPPTPHFLLVARSSPSSYNKNHTCHFSTEHPLVTSSHLGRNRIIWSIDLYNPNWCHTCPDHFAKVLSSWICQTLHTSGSLHSCSLYSFFLLLI